MHELNFEKLMADHFIALLSLFFFPELLPRILHFFFNNEIQVGMVERHQQLMHLILL